MHRKLSDFLGDKAYRLEVFEAFANHPGEALTPPDLEAITNVPHTTLYRILDAMKEANGIHKVGERGRASLYRLNTSLPVIRILADAVLHAQNETLEAEIEHDESPSPHIHSITTFAPDEQDDWTPQTTCYNQQAS